MTSVFVLASDLGLQGSARQLALTLPALPRDCFTVQVAVLGEHGPAADSLRQAGIPVRRLPFRHPLDLGGLRNLRQAVQAFRPAVIHAVGPRAVRMSALFRGSRLVVSGASVANEGLLNLLTARQLRHAQSVLFYSESEADRYRSRGVKPDRLAKLELAVAAPTAPPDGAAFRRSLNLPPRARLIFAAGRLDRVAGLKDAIWAFDILKYDSPDFHLVLVGEGPERIRLESFGKALGFDDYRVRFAGARPDLPALLGLAEVVWVTHERGGQNIALEAMAAGRPVLGWKTAEIAERVRDGETGVLVPRGNRVVLAGETGKMLEAPLLAAKFGEAGRRLAANHTPQGAVVALGRAYESASPFEAMNES